MKIRNLLFSQILLTPSLLLSISSIYFLYFYVAVLLAEYTLLKIDIYPDQQEFLFFGISPEKTYAAIQLVIILSLLFIYVSYSREDGSLYKYANILSFNTLESFFIAHLSQSFRDTASLLEIGQLDKAKEIVSLRFILLLLTPLFMSFFYLLMRHKRIRNGGNFLVRIDSRKALVIAFLYLIFSYFIFFGLFPTYDCPGQLTRRVCWNINELNSPVLYTLIAYWGLMFFLSLNIYSLTSARSLPWG